MMHKKKRRLRSRRGETLVESLVSILIFTFASILFLSMVASAARINGTVRKADAAYAAQQQVVETGPSAANAQESAGTVTFTCQGHTIASKSVTVVRQAGVENSAYAYYFMP